MAHINAKGYVIVHAPSHPVAQRNGQCLEHRKVWHDTHGEIPSDHVIHHINGDKSDNRIENLKCMTRSDHVKEHEADWGPHLAKGRPLGTAAIAERIATQGAWNKGTAPIWHGKCDVCEAPVERPERHVRKTRNRGQRVVCSRKCACVGRKIKARGES